MKRTFCLNAALGLAALTAGPVLAQSDEAGSHQGDVTCIDVPEPVVSLSYGSRYTDESEDRSDIDQDANAAVNEALGPIDDFIVDLTARANEAASGGEEAGQAASCVVEALAVWAEADALSEMETMNANISSPSRIGALALAYIRAKQMGEIDRERAELIETWLSARAHHAMDYFDAEAPPKASRNNLRAWAGLAATAVGRTADDEVLTSWRAHTLALVACQADEDGALPLEMDRGPRALHYQLHAVGPLVVSAGLLEQDGYPAFGICDDAVPRIVDFTTRAVEAPELAEEKAGEPQTYQKGEDEVQAFELAWADAYLSFFEDAELARLVEPFRPLGNSKLGGDQSLLW
ncbi:alginate lyase family protein [Salipiger mucosus]|uniref:Alginate lyase n=1 Tax=Salipiger mucosus DSM 16094 TaxID=1123237 RepID=S9S740_9RHOB|nr:alginate lyase family protein [Salipiger mucosus]EPX86010.1 Alginate lyase precursor [Salipiger mucosus DSM 16094]